MANLKQLKTKRQSINKTRKVTRAMEAVSAVKMRKSQQKALSARGYAYAALGIMKHVAEAGAFYDSELAKEKDSKKVGVIVITSDKGLAGSLNSALLKTVQDFINNESLNPKDVVAISLGARGKEFLKRIGAEIVYYKENKKDDVSEKDMREITDLAVELQSKGETGKWYIFYTNFKSTFEQTPQMIQLFPLNPQEIEKVITSIAPEKGKFSETKDEIEKYVAVSDYIVEAQTEKNIVDHLSPMLATVVVYHSLLESKASEHSARMVAMKNATDKAGELSHILQLQFNKARQAAITREVSEITSGIEAMKE